MPRRTPRYTLVCARCGEQFIVEEHRRDTARYCSVACHNAAQTQREQRTCPQCGLLFSAKSGEIHRGGGKFCSVACRGLAKRNRQTAICVHCGGEFERTPASVGRYCSKACQYAGRKVAVACQHCGETFHRKASNAPKARYCSTACHDAARSAHAVATFWQQADKTGDCWLWTGSLIHSGYGRFTHHGKATSAHRFAFESAHGPIPDGLMVCHSCDNRRCVNPDHLFLGNAHTNTTDMVIKGRNVRGERCHTAKLTEDQVRTIRRRHALDGVSQAQLGREFGVRDRLIGRVIRRESWAHLP